MSNLTAPESLLAFARKAYANHDTAHNFDHALNVYNRAIDIVIAEGRDKIMTEWEIKMFPYIMIGHDFRDHKLIARGIGLSEEIINEFYKSELGPLHAALVIHIHNNCSWSKRSKSSPAPIADWLREILQDADWMEAIGKVGLTRCIEYTKSIGTAEKDIPAEVCKHIREKLLLIPDALNFASSRKMAESMKEPLIEYLRLNEKE
jgi:uncharacterized protein